MKLNPIHLDQIRGYIFGTPRYQETYYELYDHILNALEQKDGAYNLDMVKRIVEEDFGGFEEIVKQEEIYQKSLTGKYYRLLGFEIINFYKTSTIFSTIVLIFIGYLFYDTSLTQDINLKPISIAILILSMVPGVYYLCKRWILDRHKAKPSIKYDFLHKAWVLGFLTVNSIIGLFVSKNSVFENSNHHKVIIIMLLAIVLNIYIRSFKKIYNKRINVLAV
ncbi:MAG: hypothetical protein V4687_17705 [Bacteroidota bacterium]